jgi:hypothetical protein
VGFYGTRTSCGTIRLHRTISGKCTMTNIIVNWLHLHLAHSQAVIITWNSTNVFVTHFV